MVLVFRCLSGHQILSHVSHLDRCFGKRYARFSFNTFFNKLPLAMKRGRTRRPGTSSSSAAGPRVLKLAVHAEEEGSVSGEEDGELSDGNGSDVAIEDNGPILPLNDLLL